MFTGTDNQPSPDRLLLCAAPANWYRGANRKENGNMSNGKKILVQKVRLATQTNIAQVFQKCAHEQNVGQSKWSTGSNHQISLFET